MDPNTVQRPSDTLIALRQFVGAFGAAFNDQTFAGTDGIVYNPTGSFPVVGPNGTSVEGLPVAVTNQGGLHVSPQLLLLALGAALVFVLKK